MQSKRTRHLRPLQSEHHQALLIAFQLKQGLAGHGEAAGAPRDLAGLVALARRFEEQLFATHTRAEEEVLARHLSEPDLRRMRTDHGEMARLLDLSGKARGPEQRNVLLSFAELLERHIRWEERELFQSIEKSTDAAALADVAQELEKRLVLARTEAKVAGRR
jgi:hemerythrin-like domain-containing protein